MKRRRFIKLMMSRGFCRNTATQTAYKISNCCEYGTAWRKFANFTPPNNKSADAFAQMTCGILAAERAPLYPPVRYKMSDFASDFANFTRAADDVSAAFSAATKAVCEWNAALGAVFYFLQEGYMLSQIRIIPY